MQDDVVVEPMTDAPIVGERHVDVPEESFRVKAEFFEEPSKAVIKEIKTFVTQTGEPHLWRGHTHTRPSIGARVKYLDEFDLPAEFSKRKRWMVCPVCHPHSRHFGKRPGMIAWFWEEGVIRLIGPDCFKKLNKEGHSEALDELRIRQQREKDTRYLLGAREKHLAALVSLKSARDVAGALDTFGESLRKTIHDRLAMPIWQHVRTGVLEVTERRRETRVNPRNPTESHIVDVDAPIRYGVLAGYEMLSPTLAKLLPRFSKPIGAIEEMAAIDDWDSYVASLSDHDRHRVVGRLNQAIKAAHSLRDRVTELRSFLSVVNISTLRTWGARPDSPASIYARRDGDVLWIGRYERARMKILIPPEIDIRIAAIPDMNVDEPDL